jgi:hypothetical protein
MMATPNDDTMLDDDEYDDEEYDTLTPEELAGCEEGHAQILRGEYVTLEELRRNLGLPAPKDGS